MTKRVEYLTVLNLLYGIPANVQKARVKWLYENQRIDDEYLWHILSGHNSPIREPIAREIYIQLGFRPFAGFPLKKLEASDGI